MKLTYRGVAYEHNPPAIDMVEGEIVGKYRGQPWRIEYPRHIPVPQPAADLKYRGVAYSTYPKASTQPAIPITSSRKLAFITKSCPVSQDLTDTHLDNIRRRLEHRLQVAKNRGDESLIRMLEAESRQLVGNCR
jgi:Domain of unknown function (DUF4278)